MKNPLKPMYTPLVTLLCATVAAVLRMWLLRTGVDAKGLLIADHPAVAGCFIITALAIVGIFLCLRSAPKNVPYRALFPKSAFAAVGCWIAAAGVAITGLTQPAQETSTANTLYLVLTVAAAIAFAIVGFLRLQGKRPNPVFYSVITLYFMFRLIGQYRAWNTEPQLVVYVFQLLALVFLLLSCYWQAMLDARMGNVKLWLFYRYCALFFCCFSAIEANPGFYCSLAVWMLFECSFDFFLQKDAMDLPEQAQLCLEKLNDAGFDAYVVGGCVRDARLGLTPQDYDLCTNASPRQICKVFKGYQLVKAGEKHGTIGVVVDDVLYEITTFRTEGGYSDSRHPDWVKFAKDVKEDLARRDFTVNAMAYSPATGFIDPFGGQEDLKDQVLRTVGDPKERFTEDALRILRGARFAARYQLTPHPETEDAMLRLAGTMEGLAQERIFTEFSKWLVCATAQDLIRFAPIVTQVIPELKPTVGFDQQNPHHSYDVYTHTAYVVENTPAELSLRFAALLHDIGKPEVFTLDENGCGHFYDHAPAGAAHADKILQRLRAPNALREQVVFLVEQHMLPLEADKKILRRRISKLGIENMRLLLQLQKADFCSKGVEEDAAHFRQLEALMEEILAEDACLTLRDLAVSGNDLMELGIPAGPQLGQVLEQLLELVLDERVPNEKEALLTKVKEMNV